MQRTPDVVFLENVSIAVDLVLVIRYAYLLLHFWSISLAFAQIHFTLFVDEVFNILRSRILSRYAFIVLAGDFLEFKNCNCSEVD